MTFITEYQMMGKFSSSGKILFYPIYLFFNFTVL